ncbi:MAG: ATP-dependent Clp protease ATP-binding subunit [Xanthomonadales bacterium]|nr:ATP-dependent Clp protease ATP-binding subunit [Xanthomonadales bacterium]
MTENFTEIGNILIPKSNQFVNGRTEEINAILNRLEYSENKSFVLVGSPGSGKSTIIKEVAKQTYSRNSFPWTIIKTSCSNLHSGAVYSGELETKLGSIIKILKPSNRVILYLTDIHLMMGAGTTINDNSSIGTSLLSAVEMGDIVLAGECSREEYLYGIERYPKLSKLLNIHKIDETTKNQTEEIIKGHLEIKKTQSGSLSWDDGIEAYLIELAENYAVNIVRPGNAVDLLNKTVDSLLSNKLSRHISRDVILNTLKESTGLPIELIDEKNSINLAEVFSFFSSSVFGQGKAIQTVIERLLLLKAGLCDSKRPLGVFWFIGSTGVGKTELAKKLAEYVFGSESKLARFDMTEYSDNLSYEKLIGNHQKSEGSNAHAGVLIDKVRAEPFSLVLLDEFEKAHQNVRNLFLQVFDDARLTNSVGQTTSFKQVIIILTSNLKKSELETNFPPEFLNRIDHIIEFEPLSEKALFKVADNYLKSCVKRQGLKSRLIKVKYEDCLIEFLIKEYMKSEQNMRYGARPIKRIIEKKILVPIAQVIASDNEGSIKEIDVTVSNGVLSVKKIMNDKKLNNSSKSSTFNFISKRKNHHKFSEPFDATQAGKAHKIPQFQGFCYKNAIEDCHMLKYHANILLSEFSSNSDSIVLISIDDDFIYGQSNYHPLEDELNEIQNSEVEEEVYPLKFAGRWDLIVSTDVFLQNIKHVDKVILNDNKLQKKFVEHFLIRKFKTKFIFIGDLLEK